MRHGVITPNKKSQLPARVVNLRSNRRTHGPKLKLDQLVRSANPKICIKRRLGGIGDVLMTTPVLKQIKNILPNCILTYATDLRYADGSLAEIIQHNPYADRLISWEESNGEEYDYSIDITTTGLNRERPGTIPPNRIDLFAEAVGVNISADPVPTYIITAEERKWARKHIKQYYGAATRRRDVTLIAIQARSNDSRRTWPKQYVNELVDMLAENPQIQVLLFDWGHKADQWESRNGVHAIANMKTYKTAAILEQCDLTICPDSALLHLAGALHKKTIGIFGPVPPESRINHYPNATAVCLQLPCKNCIVNDSYILTDSGYKEIQNVTTDDSAYTIDGQFYPITAIHQNDRAGRKLIEFDIFGTNEPIIITEDHKLLVAKRYYSWKNKDWQNNPGIKGSKNRRGVAKISEPNWVRAQDIQPGEYCCVPLPQTDITKTHSLLQNEDLAWLLGLFVAEGWTSPPKGKSRSYETVLSLSADEQDFIDKIHSVVKANPDIFHSTKTNVGFVTTTPNSKGNSTVVHISNKSFMTLIHDIFNVPADQSINSAIKKHIPYPILYASDNIIKAFLAGLQQGDGYEGVKDIVYSTASRELAYGIQLLCAKIGNFPKIYKRTRDTNYKKNTVIYHIYQSKQTKWKRWYTDSKYVYVPIKNKCISKRTDKTVYDITVQGNPTFVTNNLSTFDCWYSPKCARHNNQRLACLNNLKPALVYEAAMKKLNEHEKIPMTIKYGRDLAEMGGGQDPIILVRRTTPGIGDLLMATPGIEALKRINPTKQLHLAINKDLWPIVENNPHIDTLLDTNSNINYKRYFMTLDISAPCAHYESIRVRAGKRVEKSRVEIYAEAMGVRPELESLQPKYYPTDEEIQWAKQFLKNTGAHKKDKPKLLIGLEAAEIYRSWPLDKYPLLFEKLQEHFVVIITAAQRQDNYKHVIDACGFPVRHMAAIMSQCDGVLAPDTSLVHFAAALGIPCIALFGPIDYRARGKGYMNLSIIQADYNCIPCWRNARGKCQQTHRVKGYSACMTAISIDTVIKAVNKKFLK